MPKHEHRERYLPFELEFGAVKARVKVKVRENETVEEIARRLRGIDVENTGIGGYIKRINLNEFLFKNKDVIVMHLEGDVESIKDAKINEQWIQVYVDDGIPVVVENGEVIGLGISNFCVYKANVIKIKDEPKTEKYMQDFSFSDVEAIIKAAIPNKASVSCPGGTVPVEFSTRVFDVFMLLRKDGVVWYHETIIDERPLGWEFWVFPENGVKKERYLPDYPLRAYNTNPGYLVGMHMHEKTSEPEIERTCSRDNKNYEDGVEVENAEGAEAKKTDYIKIENPVVGALEKQQELMVKSRHPVFAQKKNSPQKPKILTGMHMPRMREYILFDELDRAEEFKIMGAGMGRRTCGVWPRAREQQNLKSYEKMQTKERARRPSKLFVRSTKISLQNLAARIENMKKRPKFKTTTLKEKIKKMKIQAMIIKIRDKTGVVESKIKDMKTKIRFKFIKLASKINRDAGQIKTQIKKRIAKIAENLAGRSKHKNNKKDWGKNKRIIILLLLRRWFPKLKRWGYAFYKR